MDNSAGEVIDNASRSRFKTKVRRLYDIANVLTAIGLIKKVDMNDRIMKKPVFKYIGPHVDTVDLDTGMKYRIMAFKHLIIIDFSILLINYYL